MRQIIGPDVSFYQDDPQTPQGVDFVKMAGAADFVIIRAGQNLWADRDFRKNWKAAREAGLPRGAYWFFDSRADPKEQAELFWSLLRDDPGELPLFLDLEENYRGIYAGWVHWKEFLEHLRGLAKGKVVGIYTAYYYWHGNAPVSLAELEYFHRYPLWIANYGTSYPLVPGPWRSDEWVFWQYGTPADGGKYGVESIEIDMNVFNGTEEDFEKLKTSSVPSGDEPMDPTFYKWTATGANLRNQPTASASDLGDLRNADVVRAVDASGTWYRIDDARHSDGSPVVLTNGKTVAEYAAAGGKVWVTNAYLSKVDSMPGAPAPDPVPPTLPDLPVTIVLGDDVTYVKQTVNVTLKPK